MFLRSLYKNALVKVNILGENIENVHIFFLNIFNQDHHLFQMLTKPFSEQNHKNMNHALVATSEYSKKASNTESLKMELHSKV